MALGDDTETGSEDWARTKDYLQSDPTKWNSLSWIAARTLIESVNDVLGRGTQGLVEDLRAHWTKKDQPLTIPTSGVSRFLVIGDTGEQDPSQYVVAPALARAAEQAGFVLVLSDVIYPSGNVNDYVDGFYKPYRSNRVQGLKAPADVRAEFALPENVPVYAMPGNHDWYDGLYGFAHQFLYPADAPPTWPSELLAPSFEEPLGRWQLIRDRFGRIMWRTPSEPAGKAAPARWGEPASDGEPAPEAMLQPAPYFVIETEHVDLVCIDTGIDGTIDAPQFDWLSSLGGEKPKILMTGKPLFVNGERRKCAVSGRPDKTVYDAVVAESAHRYVATVGGDTHNFQLYDPTTPDSSRDGLWHIVSGGGGAYTHATHPIRTATSDARTELRFSPTKLFPRSAESLSYFAQQLVPSIWRLLLTVVLFGGGVVVGRWLAETGWSCQLQLGDQLVRVGPGGVAIAAMIALVLLHQMPQRPGRSHFVRRLLLRLEALAAGVLATLFLHQYLPDAAGALLVLFGTSTLWICLNAWCIRWSRWWSPVERVPGWHHVAFVFVLAALVVLALLPMGLDAGGSDDGRTVSWVLVVAVGLYVVLAIIGWRKRIVTTVNGARAARWLERSVVWAVLAQAAVVSGEMLRVMSGEGLTVLFLSGLLGLVPVAVIAVVVLAAILAPDLLTRHLHDEPVRRARAWLRWRRWLVQPLVFLAAPLTLALWGWVADAVDSAWMRAAFALPTLITVTAIVLLVVDWVRREYERLYMPLLVVAVLAVGVLLLGAAVPGLLDVPGFEEPGRLANELRTWWPAVAVGAALFTAVAVGAAVLLAHLVFLGAYLLVVDPKAWVSPRYRQGGPTYHDFISEADATAIIEAEQKQMGSEPAKVEGVGRRTRRRAQIAFPGLNPPFGPIQKFVSEIYSLDEPPFFKHFLEFETSPTEVVVKIHRVRGDQPVEIEEVARIRLADAPLQVTDGSLSRETRTSDPAPQAPPVQRSGGRHEPT